MSTKLSYVTPPCCKRPSVAVMDHAAGHIRPFRPIVNRTCLSCSTHWYGNDGVAVVTFTAKAWDRWMSSPEQVAA